ncbi:gamma-glutamyl-gamma-aminobutyrate hydrolase [bacterium]|nr:gamma-glutamyl-gamma-aminobutyrate hydrolase [bacterium]|tara:strand:+ start:35 stop:697 length:663 start_codon:yes stop_codon:yes gene_type:complete
MKKILIPSAYLRSDLDDLDKVSYFYTRYVSQYGGIPIIAPSVINLVSQYVSMCDAVLLIGGVNDVDPSLYGTKLNGSKECNRDQDEFELAVLNEAILQNKPVLGICRGMQLINVYFGGDLIQHLDSSDLHLQYERQEEFVHDIDISKSKIFKDAKVKVNSVHHQACQNVPSELNITAYSADGVIEMLEHKTLPILGVQWHPECISNSEVSKKLMHWLLNA